ncbi:cyclic amine resistance locus protein [Hepatocystis sp. ex Piliocolobus tephrosceles]|nr:cyclic amine resistance locus protein [Hepatocystis sp. ex Piliocolobus tephrosceles]
MQKHNVKVKQKQKKNWNKSIIMKKIGIPLYGPLYKNGKSDKNGKNGKSDKNGKNGKSDKNGKNGKSDKNGQNGKIDKNGQNGKIDKNDKNNESFISCKFDDTYTKKKNGGIQKKRKVKNMKKKLFKQHINSLQLSFPECSGLIRMSLILICIYIFSFLDTSRIYHYIRAQPFMKLYVVLNMLEIFERLLRSIGKDLIDNMIRTFIRIINLRSYIYIIHNSYDNMKNEKKIKKYKKKKEKKQKKQNWYTAEENVERRTEQNKNNSFFSKLNSKKCSSCVNNEVANGDMVNDKQLTLINYSKQNETSGYHPLFDFQKNTYEKKNDNVIDFIQNKINKKYKLYLNHKKLYHNEKSNKNLGYHHSPTNVHIKKKNLFFNDNNFKEENKNFKIPIFYPFYSILIKFVMQYILVLIYILIHAFAHLVRFLSLNIAINSSESTMFLILVMSNFAEIKSTVFKKFTKISLFTIVASDAVERFYLFIDAFLVLLKMSTAYRTQNSFLSITSWLSIILLLEVGVDWCKHSYLLKYNKLKSESLNRYFQTLLADVLISRTPNKNIYYMNTSSFEIPCKNIFCFSHIPTRRLGYMSMPVVTLIVCSLPRLKYLSNLSLFSFALSIWVCLFLFKIILSIMIVSYTISKKQQLKNLGKPYDDISAL